MFVSVEARRDCFFAFALMRGRGWHESVEARGRDCFFLLHSAEAGMMEWHSMVVPCVVTLYGSPYRIHMIREDLTQCQRSVVVRLVIATR